MPVVRVDGLARVIKGKCLQGESRIRDLRHPQCMKQPSRPPMALMN